MAIRLSMTKPVRYLRQYGNAAEDDVFSGVTFWTDDQLLEIMDRFGQRGTHLMVPATQDYLTYVVNLPEHQFIDSDTIVVIDSAGDTVSTTYTLNADRLELVFDSALDDDETYFIEALFFNMWLCLADLWQQKAGQRAGFVDFKAGQNTIKLGQERDYCLKMSHHYRRKIGRRHHRRWRS